MKKGLKLVAVGTVFAAAVLGALQYRRYKDSYEMLPEDMDEENAVSEEDSDFVPMESFDDDFDYIIEDVDQIMFHE